MKFYGKDASMLLSNSFVSMEPFVKAFKLSASRDDIGMLSFAKDGQEPAFPEFFNGIGRMSLVISLSSSLQHAEQSFEDEIVFLNIESEGTATLFKTAGVCGEPAATLGTGVC